MVGADSVLWKCQRGNEWSFEEGESAVGVATPPHVGNCAAAKQGNVQLFLISQCWRCWDKLSHVSASSKKAVRTCRSLCPQEPGWTCCHISRIWARMTIIECKIVQGVMPADQHSSGAHCPQVTEVFHTDDAASKFWRNVSNALHWASCKKFWPQHQKYLPVWKAPTPEAGVLAEPMLVNPPTPARQYLLAPLCTIHFHHVSQLMFPTPSHTAFRMVPLKTSGYWLQKAGEGGKMPIIAQAEKGPSAPPQPIRHHRSERKCHQNPQIRTSLLAPGPPPPANQEGRFWVESSVLPKSRDADTPMWPMNLVKRAGQSRREATSTRTKRIWWLGITPLGVDIYLQFWKVALQSNPASTLQCLGQSSIDPFSGGQGGWAWGLHRIRPLLLNPYSSDSTPTAPLSNHCVKAGPYIDSFRVTDLSPVILTRPPCPITVWTGPNQPVGVEAVQGVGLMGGNRGG